MPAETTIVEVCDVLREALRRRGLFERGLEPGARRQALRDAVEEAAGTLGLKLTLAPAAGSGHTVVADDLPGLITIVPQEGEIGDKVDPDFGVTWVLA